MIIAFCFLLGICLGFLHPGPRLGTAKDIKPLNLVDNNFFYNFNYFNFNTDKHLSSIYALQDTFRNCLIRNGVKKGSFYNCVGPNYKKVDMAFHRRLANVMMNYQNVYLERLNDLCKNKYDPSCSRLKESFNNALKDNENPVESLRKTRDNFHLAPKISKKFEEFLQNAQKNYDDYVKCQRATKLTRDRALSRIESVLEQTNTRYTDKPPSNPFYTAEELKQKSEANEKNPKQTSDQGDFNTDILRFKRLKDKFNIKMATGTFHKTDDSNVNIPINPIISNGMQTVK